jgi:hypothetical protein
MSCQDDREETPVCRLQSGQGDECFQHVIGEEISVIEQKDR